MDKFAHSVEGKAEAQWEPLADHLAAVGSLAREFAAPFGCSEITQVMGWLHDIGKASLAYQTYIRKPREAGGPKGPDHSSAGAQEAVRAYGRELGRLMAFGIAGHHAGLMDGSGYDGSNLDDRLTKAVEDYDGWRDHVGVLPIAETLAGELKRLGRNGIDPAFTASFLVRMLFSCLVDADFLETERFYALSRGEARPKRGGIIRAEHQEKLRAFLAKHRRDDTRVNKLRSVILDYANAKAAMPPGLFTLTVPTGGGKTLTSLSFAMEHAMAHDLRRIIYVIPFTSIIEQTASVFRDEVELGEAVLEHHSSFDWERQAPASDNDSEGEGAAGHAKLRRDAENWDAPIVVTTAVQFFESLFAARTSKARKLHNLAKSVIILDEAQSIPVQLLRPCMAVIDELARNYGATIILCTATQPALRQADDALPKTPKGEVEGLDIPEERELAPDPKALYAQLRRVQVEWRREAVADSVLAARFAEQEQMLCIVNSRKHAHALFQSIRDQAGAIHLTTLMCARHRRVVLAKARADLKAGQPVRLVSTSLIEAGVDISFPEVWRAASGLSNIAQAAGRSNRNGELGALGEVFGRMVVFESSEHKIPPMIAAFYNPAKNVLRQDGIDLLGLDAVMEYYRWLYWEQGYDALDKTELPDDRNFQILPQIRKNTRFLTIPFGRIAQAFRMIDEAMDPVIVPWDDEARAVIDHLHKGSLKLHEVQRRLQQYIVPIPSARRTALIGKGLEYIRPEQYGDRFVVMVEERRGVLPPLYDQHIGMRLDDVVARSSEDNIFM